MDNTSICDLKVANRYYLLVSRQVICRTVPKKFVHIKPIH